jgi:hypothetical protein
MSENVDLVRSIYAAWERGDYKSAEWADPEIEWVFADGPEPGTWTGLDGMSEGWRDWLSAWEDFRVEADEYRALDAERVRPRALQRARKDKRFGRWGDADDGRGPVPRPQRQGDQVRRLLGPRPSTRRPRPRSGCRLSVMASANLDLVRSICACWERGDFSSAEWAHAEIELVFADGPETGSWTGLNRDGAGHA